MRITDNRLVWTTLIACLLLSAVRAHALSCAPRLFTLAEAYEEADSIIVGQVTQCEQETSSDEWTEGGSGCAFDSLEVLKESTSARDYRGVANSQACGLALYVGHQYLLFLDRENQPLHFSATLTAPPGRSIRFTQREKDYLRVLREFRDGALGDLSEPWSFNESETSCTIGQDVSGHKVVFGRQKPPSSTGPSQTWTREIVDGNTIIKGRVQPGGPDSGAPVREVEVVIIGIPEYPPEALTLGISFRERQPSAMRKATISVNDKTWSLHRAEQSASFGGVPMPTIVRYMVAGETAEQILSAMTTPSHLSASAVVVDSPAPASLPRDPIIRFDTRSTQLAAVLDQFEQCSGHRESVSDP